MAFKLKSGNCKALFRDFYECYVEVVFEVTIELRSVKVFAVYAYHNLVPILIPPSKAEGLY